MPDAVEECEDVRPGGPVVPAQHKRAGECEVTSVVYVRDLDVNTEVRGVDVLRHDPGR